jgi:tetratricopeptide (TPR) repeat protein
LAEAFEGIGEVHYYQYYHGWDAEQRNLQDAVASFQQALRLNPRLASAYAGQAWVHWLNGHSEECLKQGQSVARLGLTDPESLLARADAYTFGGLRDKAVALYRRVAELDPANYEAHLALPETYVYTGQLREVIAAGELFLRKFGDRSTPETYLSIGIAHHCLGDPDKARANYERALAADPEYWRIHRRVGVLDRQAGRPAEARQVWEQGRQVVARKLDAYPQNARVRAGLAIFDGYLGDREALGREEARLLREVPENNGLLLQSLGLAYAHLGDLDRAVEYYRRALRAGLVDYEMEHALKSEGLERLETFPAFREFLEEYHQARDRLWAVY